MSQGPKSFSSFDMNFTVHISFQAILSARSTVFRAMFQHDMRESKSNEINIQDIDFNTVRDMVKFIYSGRLKDLADKSDLLLAAADKYDIRDLKNICSQHLAANLSTDQVRV